MAPTCAQPNTRKSYCMYSAMFTKLMFTKLCVNAHMLIMDSSKTAKRTIRSFQSTFLVLVLYYLSFAVYDIQAGTVLQELIATPRYSTFLGWLSDDTKGNLGDNAVSITVFIPTNDAVRTFLKTHPVQADNIHWLGSIAEHCVVHGNLDLFHLKEKESVVTGDEFIPKLWISVKNESVYINNGLVTASISASNGHVHALDAVIYPLGVPSTLKEEIELCEEYSGLKYLVANATEVGDLLEDASDKFTVFSPNPKAVTNDMKARGHTQLLPVIRRHVVRGQVLFRNMLIDQGTPLPSLDRGETIDVKFMDNALFVGSGGYWSMVESFDYSTSNGVIHVINGVLGETTGVNVYLALGLFDSSKFDTTLNKISYSAELMTDWMDTTKKFTVFSPHNTAWEDVSTSDITTMKKVLNRHVILEKLTAAELMTKSEVITRNGEKLLVTNENGKVFLEFDNIKAEVTSTDNMASNGVIHAIDKVLRKTSSGQIAANFPHIFTFLVTAILHFF